MDTIDRAAAALGFADWAAMSAALYLMGAEHGFALNVGQRNDLPTATRDQLAPGAIIAVHGHQCARVARVWAVTPTKVSAVYLTPTAIERAQKSGKGTAVPNNVTAKIAECGLVKVAPETAVRDERLAAEQLTVCELGPTLRRTDADPLHCTRLATTTVRTLLAERPACAPCAATYADESGIEQPAAPAPVGGGSALVADDAYDAGMLPLAGGDGFLF